MTQYSSIGQCPVCNTASRISQVVDAKHFDCSEVTCPRCGYYMISNTVEFTRVLKELNAVQIKHYATVPAPSVSNSLHVLCRALAKAAYSSKTITNTNECRSIISHVLSRGHVSRLLTFEDFTNILTHTVLPSPAEQADNLIKYCGDTLSGVGDTFAPEKESDEFKNLGARIGSRIGSEWDDFYALVVALEAQGLLYVTWGDTTFAGQRKFYNVSLTLSGWNKYEEMDRKIRSRSAFVAMKFKSSDGENYYFQDVLLPKYLVDAVRQTDFVLGNPLADNPQAGNLHARLEVEIKNARFVLAELSHSNNGAYWEAGFAKGLGKPVIYMYNRKIGNQDKPHFDVGSDQIIFWDEEKPEQAAQSLKDIIRNTLFGEAQQNDDPA